MSPSRSFVVEVLPPGTSVSPAPAGYTRSVLLEHPSVGHVQLSVPDGGVLPLSIQAGPREAPAVAVLDGYILEDERGGRDGLQTREGISALVGRFLAAPATFSRPLPGCFSLLVVDGARQTIDVLNDSSGASPWYTYSPPGPGSRVVFANALTILRRLYSLRLDSQSFAEQYMLTWSVGDRTVFDGVSRLVPGSRLTVSTDAPGSPDLARLSRAWTGIDPRPRAQLLEDLGTAFARAVDRTRSVAGDSPGIMLSGGLDSRLVLGELLAQGIRPLACTHGDAASEEVAIAKTVAAANGLEILVNPMDETFAWDDLHIDESAETTDLIFNPIWYSSVDHLAARGAHNVFTGCLGDVLLGGSYYYDTSARVRFGRNLKSAVGLSPYGGLPAAAVCLDEYPKQLQAYFKKHSRWCKGLLRPPLQEALTAAGERVAAEVRAVLERYLADGPITGPQLQERFGCEHRDRKYVFGQELAVRRFGEPMLPTLDPDVLEILTNVDPNLKYDHALYYSFLRSRYPALAQINVANLAGSVASPQLVIELRRAFRVFAERRKPKGDPRSFGWVNFETWARTGERLALFEAAFLRYEGVFDPDAVRTLFEAIRQKDRLLYDGNNLFSLLATAKLVDGL